MNVEDIEELKDEWEMIPKQRTTVGVRREYLMLAVGGFILKGKKKITRLLRAHRIVSGTVTLTSRLVWLNCTMSQWFPSHIATPASVALVCMFLYTCHNNK